MYSIVNHSTFDALPSFIQKIRDIMRCTTITGSIVGTHLDLANNQRYACIQKKKKKKRKKEKEKTTKVNYRAVTKEEGEQLAISNGLLFFEVSSKTKENVEEVIHKTASAAMWSQHKTLQQVSLYLLGAPQSGKVCLQERKGK